MVLIDLAEVRPGHWVEDAVYLERLHWARPERLKGRNPVKLLAAARRRLGLEIGRIIPGSPISDESCWPRASRPSSGPKGSPPTCRRLSSSWRTVCAGFTERSRTRKRLIRILTAAFGSSPAPASMFGPAAVIAGTAHAWSLQAWTIVSSRFRPPI